MEAISIRDFSFAYPDGFKNALSCINMDIEEGAFCLLIGPSGSGKTTLCKCLCPPLFPVGDSGGTIELFGYDQKFLSNQMMVGFVQQDPDAQIVCDKVWREIAFGLENLGMEQSQMHRRVAEVATYFDLASIFNRECKELSGGQKQLLNIASVIAMNPKLLVLDEPTAQLDPISERCLVDVLMHINRAFGTTIVVATHSPESFSHAATCAYELTEGEIAEIATSSAVPASDVFDALPYYESEHARQDTNGVPPVVSIKDASFAYSKGQPDIIDALQLDVAKGEILSLVGANGSGKTTLLKMIAGVLKPQSGKVENALRDSQAYLPQNVKLLFSQDSVFEELMGWAKSAGYSEGDALDLAKAFGLESVLESNPLDLSFGQQQKLGIAKMLLCKPELLLFDEPTKGLDGESQLEIARILVDIANEGRTVFIASHDLAFASRISSKMALIFNGEIACMQDAKSFCEENIFYIPQVTQFSKLWDESHVLKHFKGPVNG